MKHKINRQSATVLHEYFQHNKGILTEIFVQVKTDPAAIHIVLLRQNLYLYEQSVDTSKVKTNIKNFMKDLKN